MNFTLRLLSRLPPTNQLVPVVPNVENVAVVQIGEPVPIVPRACPESIEGFHRFAPFQLFNGSVTARDFASKRNGMSFLGASPALPRPRRETRGWVMTPFLMSSFAGALGNLQIKRELDQLNELLSCRGAWPQC